VYASFIPEKGFIRYTKAFILLWWSNFMRRVSVLVKGRVQRVGFRDFVQEVARQLGVAGYVENVKPYDVRVVAEGDEHVLVEFLKRIKSPPLPAVVEDVQVSWEKATGEFEYFEIRRGSWEEELGERLDLAAHILYTLVGKQEEHIELTREILSKQDKHIELTREILSKQEEHIEITKEILHETKQISRKQDEHIEITRSGFESVTEELRGHRELHEEIRKLREEFTRLKEALREAGISVG
jgi:acylphosphatase